MAVLGSVAKAVQTAVLIAVFSLFHLTIHLIDMTLIRGARFLVRTSTRLVGWPREGSIASAVDPQRTSQREKSIYIHAQDRSLASSRFGWPVVLTEDECEPATFKVSSPSYTNHISTILANFKPVADIHYHREIVQSFDGCDLAVDWAYPRDNLHLREGFLENTLDVIAAVAKNRGFIDSVYSRFGVPPCHPYDIAKQAPRVMSIVPGLLSDSSTTYIRSFVRVALSHGFSVAVVHTRGIATQLTRPKMFHGGLTDDVRYWTYHHLTHEALQRRFGRRTHAVIAGFSLGANILAKFLAEDGDHVSRNSAVIAACAVSAPWRFHDVSVPMNRWIQKKTYDAEFLAGLKHYITWNRILRDPMTRKGVGFDYDVAMAGPDVPSIDANVVVPHHGFRDTDDYYTQASCFPILDQVTLPLCCVGVADDPICGPPPAEDEWKQVCGKTKAVCYAELPSGGHLGCLGHPLAELTRQPTGIEAIVCRSMAHFVARYEENSSPVRSPVSSQPPISTPAETVARNEHRTKHHHHQHHNSVGSGGSKKRL